MVPHHDTINHARNFFEKFGFTEELSIDKFDMFIIDNKLADDPGTSDTSDPRYKAFVGQRSAARHKLNKGAAYCPEAAFVIEVVESGVTYRIAPWAEGNIDFAKDIGNRVAKFAEGKRATLKSLAKRADHMLERDPSNAELIEATHMLSFMAREGLQLQAKVHGLVNQYNVAADAVERQFAALTQQKYEFEAAGELEHLGS